MKWLERLFGKKVRRNEGKAAMPQPNTARPASKQVDADNIQKKRRILIAKCMEVLGEQVSKRMNEQAFSPCSVSCSFPGTRNKAYLRVIADAADKSVCRLTASAAREGSDLCVMNYLQKGTPQEMLAWLSDEAHVEELIGYIEHLSESVDGRTE